MKEGKIFKRNDGEEFIVKNGLLVPHSPTPEEGKKMTNGGKPHICGEPAIHNGTKKDWSFCLNCGLGVDTPKEEKPYSNVRDNIDTILTNLDFVNLNEPDYQILLKTVLSILSEAIEATKEEVREQVENCRIRPIRFYDEADQQHDEAIRKVLALPSLSTNPKEEK